MKNYLLLTFGLFVALMACNDNEHSAAEKTADNKQVQEPVTSNYASNYIKDTNEIGRFTNYEIVKDEAILEKLNLENIFSNTKLYGIIERANDEEIEEIYISSTKAKGTNDMGYELSGNAAINVRESAYTGMLTPIEIRKVKTDWTDDFYICLFNYEIKIKEQKDLLLKGISSVVVGFDKDGTVQPFANASEFHNYLQFVGVLTEGVKEYKCIFNNDFYSVYSELPYISPSSYKKLFGEEPYEFKPTEFMKNKFPNISTYFEDKR